MTTLPSDPTPKFMTGDDFIIIGGARLTIRTKFINPIMAIFTALANMDSAHYHVAFITYVMYMPSTFYFSHCASGKLIANPQNT